MTQKKEKAARINYRRIELLIPPHISAAVDDYRASKRPIPTESDALRWLISDSLISEGFDPYDAHRNQ